MSAHYAGTSVSCRKMLDFIASNLWSPVHLRMQNVTVNDHIIFLYDISSAFDKALTSV